MKSLKEQKVVVNSIKLELAELLKQAKIIELERKIIRDMSGLLAMSKNLNTESRLINLSMFCNIETNSFNDSINEIKDKIKKIKNEYIREYINLLRVKNKRMSFFSGKISNPCVKNTEEKFLFMVPETLSGKIRIDSFELYNSIFSMVQLPSNSEQENFIHVKTNIDQKLIWFFEPQSKQLIRCTLLGK